MASVQQQPTVMRQLEPPGFLALNYGYQTPLSILIAHLVYGVILGVFCRLKVRARMDVFALAQIAKRNRMPCLS